MTGATARIRARRTNERRLRIAGEWALVLGTCLFTAMLAVGVVAISIARYHAGL